jgi:hypothetical protein
MRAHALEARLEALTDRVERMGVCLRSDMVKSDEDGDDDSVGEVSSGDTLESKGLDELFEELQYTRRLDPTWGPMDRRRIKKMYKIVAEFESTNGSGR